MIITTDNFVGIEELKKILCQHFEMNYLGPLCNFFGIQALPSRDGLFLLQTKYASDLVSR